MIKTIAIAALLPFFLLSTFAQPKINAPISPLSIPLFLTGNFGELRANHFHSGLDFKTQNKIGFPVYAFDDGYVSRLMIAVRGNGRALYIIHPNGTTTVYLHLDKFSPTLESMLEDFQYAEEKFEVNHYFKENEVKVKKGDLIAFSGNSGSSAGPHLHFELRDTKTEEVMDPIIYFRNLIKDHVAPKAREVVIYPMYYGGLVNGKTSKSSFPIIGDNLRQIPTVWGKIAFGIKAFDMKDGVGNVYGVKSIKLLVDDELISEYKIDRFAFKNTRCINSCIDYKEWRSRRSTILKSYVEPGNKIGLFDVLKNGGILEINEERDYKVKYILTDEYGNSSDLSFSIRGKKEEIPQTTIDCRNKIFCDRASYIKASNMHLDIPAGILYDDVCVNYSSSYSSTYYSNIHHIHTPDVPMNDYCTLELKIEKDTLSDKSKYYLARVAGKSATFQKCEYKKGWMSGSIREFGDYAVAADFRAPSITKLKSASTMLEFKITDFESGIASYRGTIDGKFALFGIDPKRNVITCRLSPNRVSRGELHQLKVVVVDNCRNESQVSESFSW